LGIGDWGLANPQSPIPNPQSPVTLFKFETAIKIMKSILPKITNNYKIVY